MKAPHPADAANDALIAEAVRFDVSLFLGAGAYDRASVATKPEAFVAARRLAARNPACSRHPLIYAVNAQGRSAVVPFNLSIEQEPAMTTTTKIFDKKFNAQRKAATLEARFPHIKFEVASAAVGKGHIICADLTAQTAHQANVLRDQGVEVSVPVGALAKAEAPEGAANTESWAAAKAKTSAKKTAAAKSAAKSASADDKALGKRAAVLAAAEAGKLPEPPDFSAATHARFRKKLDELVKLVKAGDIKALQAFKINPVSSSPKAMDKYRNLAVIALKARAAKKAAA
jgi:hypothetical protein